MPMQGDFCVCAEGGGLLNITPPKSPHMDVRCTRGENDYVR